jgi:hypothetical protein
MGRSSSSQQARHQGRRTTTASLRLIQNPAGRCLQWTQNWTDKPEPGRVAG